LENIMIKQGLMAATLALSAASMAVPATAQLQTQGGLVNVAIGDVSILNNFLNDTQIAALNNLNVPITVQVPIGVAANVCNVSAAVLGGTGPQAGKCEAKSGSQALAQAVNRQMLSQKKK
jgi:hypothetical protein